VNSLLRISTKRKRTAVQHAELQSIKHIVIEPAAIYQIIHREALFDAHSDLQ
jgi:hypothetical protein